MIFRHALSVVAAVLGTHFTGSQALAQEWPTKPVRILVPYVAGGGGDITTRLIGARLSEVHKQPFLVENRPGAAGQIAGEVVLKAPADGHTLMFESQSISVTPAIRKDLPFDVLKSFQPVAQAVTQAFLVVLTASLPTKTLRDIVELSKRKPGGLNATVSGSGTQLSA